ncbi:Hypothetical protein R9X50_00556900 [Acrodontium crateriforme]|uniref:NAD(P)-binding domain-containing protein n=1 Tax=Acrodontium crateriforme TaxID=150365 RepID=A0AAQ3MCQ1_9PEZI|nr:Hypothetical protein R9X50_00556900 [Acrodontium crateriforme]
MAGQVQEKVIVFGPTGYVGSVVAKTSTKYGSKVTLAMRDTNKTIRGLSAEDEKDGNYTRIQADLTKADTVSDAVKKSGAKAAFVYLAHQATDGMASVWQALKDGGIEFVVFLSSFTVPDKAAQMEKVDPSDHISYVHTQAELALAKVFSEKEHVCVRPGYFATNALQQKLGILANDVRVIKPDLSFDYITPDDMGAVAGNILSKGQRDGQNIVPIFGPDLLSQREAFLKIGGALDREIRVSEATDEEALANLVAGGTPEPLAKVLVKTFRNMDGDFVSSKKLSKGQLNVEKYASRPALRLDDWVRANMDLFATEISDVATEMPESAPEPDVVLPEDEVKEEAEADDGKEPKEGEKKTYDDAEKDGKD